LLCATLAHSPALIKNSSGSEVASQELLEGHLGSDLDLTSSPPGPDARLTVVAILGGVKILVAPGTHVSRSAASARSGAAR
jgi:hypothetical protein